MTCRGGTSRRKARWLIGKRETRTRQELLVRLPAVSSLPTPTAARTRHRMTIPRTVTLPLVVAGWWPRRSGGSTLSPPSASSPPAAAAALLLFFFRFLPLAPRSSCWCKRYASSCSSATTSLRYYLSPASRAEEDETSEQGRSRGGGVVDWRVHGARAARVLEMCWQVQLLLRRALWRQLTAPPAAGSSSHPAPPPPPAAGRTRSNEEEESTGV